MSETPYQVYLYVGENPPDAPKGVTLVDVTPAELSSEAALAALERSGLTAADLRTRVLLIAAPGYSERAVLMYAALCGFAGRRVDFTDLSEVVDARSLHAQALEVVDDGKPDPLPDFVQVGAACSDPALPVLSSVDSLTSEDATLLRYARHARIAIGDRTPKEALALLVAVAGVRCRGGADRLPVLVDGPEEFSQEAEVHAGLDLDAVRRAAAEMRRSKRTDDRHVVVAALPLTKRQELLARAAAAPAEEVLARLGSFREESTGFWRCPRPERHRNGDANPSTRLNDGLVRCFRCDLEPVDMLRLVMDCLRLSPDEAAGWLLSDAS